MKNKRYILVAFLMLLPIMTASAAVVGPGPKPVKKAVVKPTPVHRAVTPAPVKKAVVKPGPSPVKRAIR